MGCGPSGCADVLALWPDWRPADKLHTKTAPLRIGHKCGSLAHREQETPRLEEQTMSSFTLSARLLAGSILAGLMGATSATSVVAQQKAAPPDFSSNQVGWVGLNGGGPGFAAVA